MKINTNSWHYKLRKNFYTWSACHIHTSYNWLRDNGTINFDPNYPLGARMYPDGECYERLTNCQYIWELVTIPLKGFIYGVLLTIISPFLLISLIKDKYCNEVTFEK